MVIEDSIARLSFDVTGNHIHEDYMLYRRNFFHPATEFVEEISSTQPRTHTQMQAVRITYYGMQYGVALFIRID